MKKIIFAIVIALFLAGIVIAVGELYNPLWKATINSELSEYKDDFILGVGKPAKDIYDSTDILKAPMAPGKSIIIQSVVNNRALAGDYRADITIGTSKKWKLTLIASDAVGIGGNETLTWDLEKVPRKVKLTLIDYGTDSTRSKIVKTINIKTISSYSFNVPNKVGAYRYIDIKATKTF